MNALTRDRETEAWDDYADACLEHDSQHALHACAELSALRGDLVRPLEKSRTAS